MARRRRRKGPSLLPWFVLLAVLLGAGYWLWRQPPAWFSRAPAAPPPAATSEVPVALPPPAGALDVCGFAAPAALAQALGTVAVDARHVGAGADVPAQGACTWRDAHEGHPAQVVALVFTRASLAEGHVPGDAHAYYQSIATGLEYTYKEAPKPITGLGDEAAAGGFNRAGTEPAQVVVRRGDSVLTLVVTGIDRAHAEQVARLLAPQLP